MSGPEPPAIRLPARDNGEPAFEEPWQAQVLAVAFALSERELFSRGDWANALGAELRHRSAQGEPDSLHTYYAAALCALESLVTKTGALSNGGLERRTELWRRAYLNTPHGEPVEMENATACGDHVTAGRDSREGGRPS